MALSLSLALPMCVCFTAGLQFLLKVFFPHGGFGLVSISLNSSNPAGSSDVEIKYDWLS